MQSVEPFVPTKTVTGHMAVMSEEGDTTHAWDKNNPADVAIARRTFNKFRQMGYAAFLTKTVNGVETKDEQIKEFDPEAERIIFVPQLQGG